MTLAFLKEGMVIAVGDELLPVSNRAGRGAEPLAHGRKREPYFIMSLPERGNFHNPLLPNHSQPKSFSA